MKIGNIELPEPLPKLRRPHVIAAVIPWVDAGSVGSITLSRLERHLGATDLGSLATPGTYFDFTRYRPITYYDEGGQRHLSVPNTTLRYGLGHQGSDFILLHMLEPHSFAEEYIDSLVEVLLHFGVQRYCRIGGMYDAVPHTRPLPIVGTLDGEPLKGVEGIDQGRRQGGYQGPTSILNRMGDKLSAAGVENMTLMVRLPNYLQLERDNVGRARLMRALCSLYDFPEDLATVSQRGERQYARVTAEMEQNSEFKDLVHRLEADYDARRGGPPQGSEEREQPSEETLTPLPPSIQQFLGELGQKLDES